MTKAELKKALQDDPIIYEDVMDLLLTAESIYNRSEMDNEYENIKFVILKIKKD